jgi:ATP-dependent RNA helicase DBP3
MRGFGVLSTLMRACGAHSEPTPIQAQAWPCVLNGRDVVAVAETGSGKTLAFALPGIHMLADAATHRHRHRVIEPLMLVLAPTRELALQTQKAIAGAVAHAQMEVLCVYGGDGATPTSAAHIVVATVGRLVDLIAQGRVALGSAKFVVLDEADRMLHMGFLDDVRNILAQCAPQRQTLMFSATWPREIQELAAGLMRDPVHIRIGKPHGDDQLKANRNISQSVEVIDPIRKENRLSELLRQHASLKKILVFVLYKKEVERVEGVVRSARFSVDSIHGDKPQNQRNAALDRFRNGEVKVLVATDVAARGLDIPSVEMVINFTFPLTIEDYVHRIGRTGRAGNKGSAHTLFTLHDKAHAGELASVLKESGQAIPEELGKFGFTTKKKEHKVYGAFYKDIDPNEKPKHISFDDEE